MPTNEYLRADEFTRSMKVQTELIKDGFASVDTQLREHAERIVLIENKTKQTATGWSAGVAGAVMVIAEVVKHAWAK